MSAIDRLNKIESRADAATEGPWHRYGTWPYEVYAPSEPDGGPYIASVTGDDEHNESNAEFIARARTDVPALVAALRAVLELHAGLPYDHGIDPFGRSRVGATCIECAEEHPCPTVRAIEEALS